MRKPIDLGLRLAGPLQSSDSPGRNGVFTPLRTPFAKGTLIPSQIARDQFYFYLKLCYLPLKDCNFGGHTGHSNYPQDVQVFQC